MDLLKITIVTPEKVIYEGTAEMVIIPGSEGELGILPHHIPLFTKIKPGELKIKKEGKVEYLAITGGFADVSGDGKVTILADYAVRSEDIEIAKAEEARKKAQEAMKEKKSQADFALAEADLRKALLELKVANRRKFPKS